MVQEKKNEALLAKAMLELTTKDESTKDCRTTAGTG